MKKLVQLLAAMDIANDVLAAYRTVIVHNLSLLGGIMLGSVAFLHVLSGHRWSLVLLNVGVSAMLLSNVLATRRGHRNYLPFSIVAVLLIAGVCAAGFAMLGAGASTRLFISLSFVLLMINVVLGVLGDLQRVLVWKAITDPLTGCNNRRHLQAYLDRMVPSTDAARSGPVLLAIHIDHFKSINDRHGHDVGDAVLCRLVQVLTERQRLGDLLFRTGGEEFASLLPRSTAKDAVIVAESLREHVALSELLPGESVTISVGISESALSPRRDVKDWLKAADMALYRAKREGRNRVVLAA